MTDWAAVRAEFPALRRWTYLNTATFGQVPRRAVAAVNAHWAQRDELACADFLDWYEDMNRVRASIARLINAAPEDIAFVTNAAAALSIVTSGLELGHHDHILTLDDEFPNYQYMAHARKVPYDHLLDSIDRHTKLIALSEVNYSTGFRAPLDEISKRAADRHVPLFVDGSQSTGALVFDVAKTPVDVLAVHGYKWLISPSGAGFMYVSPQMRERLQPNIIGWRSHEDWRNVGNLHHGEPHFKQAAEKYEGGGLPFSLLYAMEASVNWMLEIGPAAIEQRVLDLAAKAHAMLLRLGGAGEDSNSQIVTGFFPYLDAAEIVKKLRVQSIQVASRRGRLRISPHFYNNEADIERLEEALEACLR
ncbi:MAG: aminotransferase class V-fold PLP-dependent enzyme [Acidobacteriota bacterium]